MSMWIGQKLKTTVSTCLVWNYVFCFCPTCTHVLLPVFWHPFALGFKQNWNSPWHYCCKIACYFIAISSVTWEICGTRERTTDQLASQSNYWKRTLCVTVVVKTLNSCGLPSSLVIHLPSFPNCASTCLFDLLRGDGCEIDEIHWTYLAVKDKFH